ncbi:MAG: CNNM domain-containing protein [Dethiobacteria bacterium]
MGEKKQRQKQRKRKKNKRWVILVSFWTFFLAIAITLVTRALLQNLRSILVSFILLIFIIFMGIFFDVIGTAVTAAEEIPFHAKAAKKIYGAKKSIFLVRHADLVANFCNDVIGDISGIVSGVIGTVIVINLVQGNPKLSEIFLSIFLAGIVSALTVGGKALGKSLAIHRPTNIVLFVARFLTTLERIFTWKRNT